MVLMALDHLLFRNLDEYHTFDLSGTVNEIGANVRAIADTHMYICTHYGTADPSNCNVISKEDQGRNETGAGDAAGCNNIAQLKYFSSGMYMV